MSLSDAQLLQMMHRIGGLLFRRFQDELNEIERLKLEEWMGQQDTVSRQFFGEVTDWEQVQTALQIIYQFDEAAAGADLQKKVASPSRPRRPIIHPGKKRLRPVIPGRRTIVFLKGSGKAADSIVAQ